ncbi:MAG: hypothetical protein ABI548_08430 [Polyangiaceae bacterium]
MSLKPLSLVLVALGFTLARAESPRLRVVLADADPALRRAVADSLEPWHIEVTVDSATPTDLESARIRADQSAARFVVWREGDQLVVFDRGSGEAERRTTRVGAYDAADAAAAALTVKTMMRLPALPADPIVVAPAEERGLEVRVEGGAGSRYERGLDSNIALRFIAAAELRPWHDAGWRFGVLGDFGASAAVDQAGFKGTWSNVSALALASWALQREAWEVGPWLAVGLEHSSLDGTEMAVARTETATLLALRGGVVVHYDVGLFTVGAIAGVEALPTTETYTKTNSPAQTFEIPPFSVAAELIVGIDLGR